MAPEVLEGAAADPRSDVYGLRCVVFEMVTGRPPFSADTPLAVAYQHVHDAVPAPSTVRADIAPAFDDVVLRATARQPQDRYPSAAAFASALRDCCDPSATTITPLIAATAPHEVEAQDEGIGATTPLAVVGPATEAVEDRARVAGKEERPGKGRGNRE